MSEEKPKKRMGRPPARTQQEIHDTFHRICEDISNGMIAIKAIKKHGFSTPYFYDLMLKNKDFASAYARAKESLVEVMANEILDIAEEDSRVTDKGNVDPAFVNNQKLRIDTRKWLLSKIAPRKYGDRVAIAGVDDAPLSVNNSNTLDVSKLPTEVLQQIMAAYKTDTGSDDSKGE